MLEVDALIVVKEKGKIKWKKNKFVTKGDGVNLYLKQETNKIMDIFVPLAVTGKSIYQS